MAVFKVETKNKVDIDKKPRVYFTCHPEDFDKYFKKICDDVFKTHDCAIYYTEDMTEVIAEDEKQVDLGRNNLFVVPVTFKLLTTPNRAMDEDIPYALKEHIPVLPIMMEPGIDKFYSNPDKFGELQYLNPYSTDITEISYDEKLKKYLESVLISDELAKRVRAAFDAYIFLSYRKKDRKYANELMRLIHSIPEYRDIAIWFDEFLTPGESFKENIEKILDDCKLFTLLVTPQLLEKVVDENGEERDNYVISTELPLARKKKQEKGTNIFAVEMEKTDREALSAINIEDYTNPKNADFRSRLLETISRMAITTNDTPEHNFLIGLAYLDGIDVEVDRERAVELLTSAAKSNLLEAMQKLQEIYYSGIGVEVNYREALLWGNKIADFYINKYDKTHPEVLFSLMNLSYLYCDLGEYEKANGLLNQIYRIRCMTLGEDHPQTLITLNNMACIYAYLGDTKQAICILEKVYHSRQELYGKYSSVTQNTLRNLAYVQGVSGNKKMELNICEELYEIQSELLGDEHVETNITLNNMACAFAYQENYFKALDAFQKVHKNFHKTLGENHPWTLSVLGNLAYIYGKLNKNQNAIELNSKIYEKQCAILGEDSYDAIITLGNLADDYKRIPDYTSAIKLYEKVYDKQCVVLGENHADTIETMRKLAFVYGIVGMHFKALKMYLKSCKRKLIIRIIQAKH